MAIDNMITSMGRSFVAQAEDIEPLAAVFISQESAARINQTKNVQDIC